MTEWEDVDSIGEIRRKKKRTKIMKAEKALTA